MGGGFSLIPDALTSATTPDELATLLGTSYSKIKYFYYTNPIANSYKIFFIQKKNGGRRTITAPNDKLKVLQKRLSGILAEKYRPKRSTKAFVKGSTIADNANPHCRKKFVFNIDLQDFFPSITFARVRGLLIAKPYSLTPETATVIAHLTTVDGYLPQGAPSSPLISNMICASLDYQLFSLASKNHATYTRYADDITFSFHCPLKFISKDIVEASQESYTQNHYKAQAGELLRLLIVKNGFQINNKKVRLQSSAERQIVTGLVVNKKPNVDRRYIRKTSALIHSIEKVGIQGANLIRDEKSPEKSTPVEAHIQGRLLFIHQVVGADSIVYARLANRFNVLPTKYKVPRPTHGKEEINKNIKISKFITNKCWVVEICTDLKLDDGTTQTVAIQGSAFAVNEGFLVTCAHVLTHENQDINECEVHLANDQSNLIPAKVVYRNNLKDIAFLSIEKLPPSYESFAIEHESEPNIGDQVAILGFPNKKTGSSVGYMRAKITNKYSMDEPPVKYSEVDKMLYPGNSGGPVINSANHVVGIASKGAAGSAEGQNAFIRATELSAEIEIFFKLQAEAAGKS